MEHALRPLQVAPAEWRRSGPFLIFALALHTIALALPHWQAKHETPPAPLSVTLIKPPVPLPIAAAKPEAPAASAKAAPKHEPAHPRPTPILAMSPEQQPVTQASPTVAPPAPPAPVAEAPAKASGTSANSTANPSISAARFDAAYLQNPKPNYPALSRRLGEEGKVMLRVRVSSEGKPLAVDLEKSSDFDRLDNAARQVVHSWRFIPAKRGDEAIEATVTVPIVFRLDS